MRRTVFDPPHRAARTLSDAQTLRVLLFLGFFVCGSLAVMQDDSWWQLRCGREIVESWSVPAIESWSFTAAGEHWPNHEWLAQAAFYGAYCVGGLPALGLLCGALFALCGVALFGAMCGGAPLRFALLLLILPWLASTLSVRPQVFTLAAMALMLRLLARRRYHWLPLLFLAWANLHGAVAVGGVALVAYCLGTAMFDRARLRGVIVTTLACGAATLCTPMGAALITFPLHSVRRLAQLGLTEWLPPGVASVQDAYFWLLLAGALLSVGMRWRSVRRHVPALVIAAVGLLPLALASARNIPLFLLAAAVAVSRAVPPSSVVSPHPADRRNGLVAVGSAIVAMSVVCLAYLHPPARLGWTPAQPNVLAAMRLAPHPMFNTYNSGGYLLWFAPSRAVFVDSRQDPYPIDFLVELTRVQRSGEHRVMFDRHAIASALVERRGPLDQRLRGDGWRVLADDAKWSVLVAPTPAQAQITTASR